MIIKIQFLLEKNQLKECIPDRIRLTRSLNEETGTIVLSFFKIFPLNLLLNNNTPISGIYIVGKNFSFFTKELRCVWQKGKPILIQAIFLIDKKEELNLFLKNFNTYSKKNVLKNYKID